jgi:hypothetical protein
MAFFESSEISDLYTEAKSESQEWRRNYNEYERLADNGLLEDLDESLPEVNDGSLAAALFKLPKRIVDTDLSGRFKALDADDAWITELANIYWINKILPNANSQAPFKRKIKDVVRKAAIYGSQPVITLLVDQGDATGADFIVPYAQDVRLEPGKVSDQDSDIIFWDIYYTKKQVKDLIEQAKAETKENPLDGYNKWDVKALEEILEGKHAEDRDAMENHRDKGEKAVVRGGIKFCIAFQRGIKAPFYMYHHATDSTVREWENPDPTGDIPVKYLYCYQDFNNPYGIGIVKLAGGTQNTLDIFRKYDILATILGVRPPKIIQGTEEDVDEDSMVYAQDANWYVGQAQVTPFEMANGVYSQLPGRMQMYQASLNKILPMGDTSVSGSESGDPLQSKTPAGVKFQASQLSIDDEDFKDNLHEWYEDVAKNLVNLTFANMQGTDLMKLTDDERDLLTKAGLEFPVDEMGEPTNELEIIWDEARATFDFELDAEDTKAKDDEKRLEGLLRIMELRATDPTIEQTLMMSGYKLNTGELLSSIINLTTDNDKILEQLDPEELEGMQQEQMMQQQMAEQGQQEQQVAPEQEQTTPEQAQVNMEAVMSEYGVSQETAAEMLMLEEQGTPPEEIQAALQAKMQDEEAMANAQ